METETLNKIEYLKKIDKDTYELLVDFIKAICYLSIEHSFFLLAGALFEKSIYSYAFSKRYKIPSDILSNSTSLFRLIDDPVISTDLFDFGLNDNLLKYINQTFIDQKHYKDLAYTRKRDSYSSKPKYDKIEYLKIFLHFYNCCYNSLFAGSNADLSDTDIIKIYYSNSKKPSVSQREADLERLSRLQFEKYILKDEICYPKNGNTIDNYSGRRDIKSIRFEGKHIKISRLAFQNCTNLQTAKLSGISIIDSGAFKGCLNLEKVVFYKCNSIGSSCFLGCIKLSKVKLSDSIKIIPFKAFAKCSSLKEVVLPKNVEVIETDAFSECPLEKIQIPKSIAKIFEGAFNHKYNYLKEEYEGVSPIRIIYEGSMNDWEKVSTIDYHGNVNDAYIKYLETNIEFLNL